MKNTRGTETKRRNPSRGFELLCGIYASMPTTNRDVVERFGLAKTGARHVLLSMSNMGLISGEWKVIDGCRRKVYSHGGVKKARRVRPNHLFFALMLSEIEAGGTVYDLADSVGISRTHMGEVVRVMRRTGLAHRVGYDGRRPIYAAGNGPDAKKPAAKPKSETNLVYARAVRKRNAQIDVLFALAANDARQRNAA